MKVYKLLLVFFFLCSLQLNAQYNRDKSFVTIQIQPDKADWVYRVGEEVKLNVSVIKDNFSLAKQKLTYSWGQEMKTLKEDAELNTDNGVKQIKLKGLNKPGFMTFKASVIVDAKTYENYITVGFEPEKIVATTKLPSDFQDFWTTALSDARKVPLAPMMTLMPELCTSDADVYHVRFQNNATGSFIYGMLSKPKKAGRYPALLRVPGAGVRAYTGYKGFFPAKNVITLEIGIHGIPVNLPAELYTSLGSNALYSYNRYNIDNRNNYYYKKVYTGCVKAVDFLCSLPDVDSTRLAVAGGSQGGALSIVTASLDKRIKCLVAYYPACSEMVGYANGEVGGWPHLFKDANDQNNVAEKVKVLAYFDVVNFARFVTAPGLYSWGFNDRVCPPTSTYCAYNVIVAPKKLLLYKESGHWTFPEQNVNEQNWILSNFGLE